jgi:2-aminoadipate transaminase
VETPEKKAFSFSRRARRSTVQPIGYLMAQAVQNPDLISLAAGLVDYDTLPGAEIADLADRVLRCEDYAKIALQYGTTEGLKALRKKLLDRMAGLDGLKPADLHASIDNVLISTGSQEMLFLLTAVLVDPGDIVLTGWPSYFVFGGTLEAAGAETRGVDMDDNGMIPESLEAVLAGLEVEGKLPRVKIVYVVSYHQNPTGITLAAERKPELIEIVRRYSKAHRILLLEDAAYRELTYEGQAPPSMKIHDRNNEFVALVGTFSKPFAPGLKTGYALLPEDLVEPVRVQKGNIDFGSANLCQHLLYEALNDGTYDRHVAELRAAYAKKRDAMLDALETELADFQKKHPGKVRWTRPRGGLYVFLTLPGHTNTNADGPLMARCLREGVLYVPGEYGYGPDPTRTKPANTMRLSFGTADEKAIREGVTRLARAIRAVDKG